MKPFFIIFKFFFFLVATTVSQSAWAQGNLIFNGGFDLNANGWTVTNSITGWRDLKGNPGGFLVLDATPSSLDPTAFQSIVNILPGTTYRVTGDYQYSIDRGGSNPADASFRVAFDGVSVFEAVKPSSLAFRDENWKRNTNNNKYPLFKK